MVTGYDVVCCAVAATAHHFERIFRTESFLSVDFRQLAANSDHLNDNLYILLHTYIFFKERVITRINVLCAIVDTRQVAEFSYFYCLVASSCS